jgi:hypothetical protein
VLEDDEADLEEVRAWAAGLQTLHARIGAGSPALGVPTISGATGPVIQDTRHPSWHLVCRYRVSR